jgi:galactonate dehydratase
MKIVSIEDMHAAGGVRRSYSFLKVTTDEGLVGWSEFNEEYRIEPPGLPAFPGLTMALRHLAPSLIGLDPREVTQIAQMLYAGSRLADGGVASHANAAIEHALLDIKAKAIGVPVYELLGGAARDRLPIYWSHCGTYRARYPEALGVAPVRTLGDIAPIGREVAERGIRALKTNIFSWQDVEVAIRRQPGRHGDWEAELDDRQLTDIIGTLEAFREGAGPRTGLMLDVNFAYKPESLRRLAKALEPLDMMWLEVDLYDPGALGALRRGTTTPIASLEAVFGARNFRAFIEHQPVDTALIDVQYNGISESLRMANLAYAHEVKVAAHQAYGHLSILHGATLCAVVPNFRIMEYDIDRPTWADSLFTHPAEIDHGDFVMPTRPGWGTDIDETAVLANPPTDVGAASWLLDYHRRHA